MRRKRLIYHNKLTTWNCQVVLACTFKVFSDSPIFIFQAIKLLQVVAESCQELIFVSAVLAVGDISISVQCFKNSVNSAPDYCLGVCTRKRAACWFHCCYLWSFPLLLAFGIEELTYDDAILMRRMSLRSNILDFMLNDHSKEASRLILWPLRIWRTQHFELHITTCHGMILNRNTICAKYLISRDH